MLCSSPSIHSPVDFSSLAGLLPPLHPPAHNSPYSTTRAFTPPPPLEAFLRQPILSLTSKFHHNACEQVPHPFPHQPLEKKVRGGRTRRRCVGGAQGHTRTDTWGEGLTQSRLQRTARIRGAAPLKARSTRGQEPSADGESSSGRGREPLLARPCERQHQHALLHSTS
jgi:hypothetical protein